MITCTGQAEGGSGCARSPFRRLLLWLAGVSNSIEAGAAIHRLVTPGQEGNLCLSSALGTHRRMHLTPGTRHGTRATDNPILGCSLSLP